MPGPEQSHAPSNAIYDALMAAKPEALTPNAWAVRAGVSRTVWADIRRHGNPTRRTLEKLLAAINVDASEFEARLRPIRTDVMGTGMSSSDVRAAWALAEAKPVPLLGTAFGSDLEEIDGIETTELMMSEVLDYLARPPSLANDAEAYAVTIIGDSMAPRFEAGEMAFVSPRAPVNVGDDVLVQLRREEDQGDINQLAGHVSTVLLKRLVRRTSATIELRQFNPDRNFTIPIARVRRIHKIRGRL